MVKRGKCPNGSKVSFKSFRAGKATQLLKQNVQAPVIIDRAEWKHPRTMARYADEDVIDPNKVLLARMEKSDDEDEEKVAVGANNGQTNDAGTPGRHARWRPDTKKQRWGIVRKQAQQKAQWHHQQTKPGSLTPRRKQRSTWTKFRLVGKGGARGRATMGED